MLLKIQSFLPYLTQWKATAKPYGKSTPAGKDAVWQEWPVHSSLSSQTLKHSSSPFLCTQWIALRTQSLQCSCWAHTTTQLNLLLGLKTVFQRTSFNVDSTFRQNICSVIKINPHWKVTIFKTQLMKVPKTNTKIWETWNDVYTVQDKRNIHRYL